MNRIRLVAIGVLTALGLTCPAAAQSKLNVLLICVDDLRPELGCYGAPHMVTPHIDRLAAEGRRFERHYVQVPSCGPSRFAMLTSRRPDESGAMTQGAFRMLPRSRPADEAVSLPHLFRLNGYKTVSLGKISHNPDGRIASGEPEIPFSWDETWGPAGEWGTSWNAFFGYAGGKTRGPAVPPAIAPVGNTPNHENADVDDRGYPDGLTAEEAVHRLRQFQSGSQPFFLGVGFFKPHLPLNAPRKYWDLYAHDKIKLSPNPDAPANTDPEIERLHLNEELTPRYTGLAKAGVVTDEEARTLRHAYYAAVSYSDAQVGKVLTALDETGLSRNTIVVLWGDHGWHLGDQGHWGKATLHERSLHAPLIIRTPGMRAPGRSSQGIVESVDIYPTLADLCGLADQPRLAGLSLRPLLDDPAHAGKGAAESAFTAGDRAGRTIRTDRYRLIDYSAGDGIVQTQLYDHRSDPLETVNIAADRGALVKQLREQMSGQNPQWATP